MNRRDAKSRVPVVAVVVAAVLLAPAACRFPDYRKGWRAEDLAAPVVDGLSRGQVVAKLGWPMLVTDDDRVFLFVAQSVVGMPLHLGEVYALRVVVFDPSSGLATRSQVQWAEAFDRAAAFRLLHDVVAADSARR